MLTLYIARASFLVLRDHRKLYLHGENPKHGLLNELQQRSADLRREDIELFLEAGEAGLELSPNLRSIDDKLVECQSKYDPPSQERDDDTNALSRNTYTTPLPLEPGKQSLPERGANHGMLPMLSPFLALVQIRQELLNNPYFVRPLPRPRMHGKPLDV